MDTVGGISHQREIHRHVDASNENRLGIVLASLTSKRCPGIAFTFRVFFKGDFDFNALQIGAVVGDQGRSPSLGESKQEAGIGLRESRVIVRNAVNMKPDKPYGVAETGVFNGLRASGSSTTD